MRLVISQISTKKSEVVSHPWPCKQWHILTSARKKTLNQVGARTEPVYVQLSQYSLFWHKKCQNTSRFFKKLIARQKTEDDWAGSDIHLFFIGHRWWPNETLLIPWNLAYFARLLQEANRSIAYYDPFLVCLFLANFKFCGFPVMQKALISPDPPCIAAAGNIVTAPMPSRLFHRFMWFVSTSRLIGN